MSEVKVTHSESWHLKIERTPDDTGWPDEIKSSYHATNTRPDVIAVTIRRGARRGPDGLVQGWVLKKDGSPSLNRRVHEGYSRFNEEFPWAAEIVERVRRENDLGPGRTGCDW